MQDLVKGLLTIGIPSYNGAANLGELFKSIRYLGLTDNEYEILVVDNASTDNTNDVIAELKLLYPNLRYHQNISNIGRVENWDKVVELSKGEYLIIMNINDRFMPVNLSRHIQYLNANPGTTMVLTNMQFTDHVYPNWIEEGVLHIDDYLKKTFLETEYLEFHSLGILHQHILRTEAIVAHQIKFDAQIPRTTDRVFIGELIKAGDGNFYYSKDVMVRWNLNNNRYHFSVHNNLDKFDFNQLWFNEYAANVQLAKICGISLRAILKSQLISASFNIQVKWLRKLKNKLLKSNKGFEGLEVPTAAVFYAYLKTVAELNNLTINYFQVRWQGFARAINWYSRSLGLAPKNKRTLKDIIKPLKA